MKRLLIAFFAIVSTVSLYPQQSTWAEQAEYNRIMDQIADINDPGIALGQCSALIKIRIEMIIKLLEKIGTPVAKKIYKEMLASGQL